MSGTNPIVIKELRQAVRSRFMIGIITFFLLFLLLATGITLLVTETQAAHGSSVGLSSGQNLFASLFSLLMFVCVFLLPIYIATRLSSERTSNGLDLLYISTLSPAAIVRGKFFSAAVLLVLIFSICLPFLTFTYLLRGIDLPTIFVVSGFGFCIAAATAQAAILFACLPLSKVFKIIIGVLAGFFMMGFVPQLLLFSLMGHGHSPFMAIGINIGSWDFWGPALTFLAIAVLMIGLMNVLSTALISPPTANRALPVRCFVTAIWIITGIAAAIVNFCYPFSTGDTMHTWLWLVSLIIAAAILITLSENDTLSYRIRHTIPRKRSRRFFFFPLYSGPAGGLVWTTILAGLSFAFAFAVDPHLFSDEDNWQPLLGLLLYFYCYGLTALLLRRTLLKSLSCGITWLIALLMMAFIMLLPFIAILASDSLSLDDYEQWQYGNPFGLFDSNQREMHLTLGATWALLISLANLKWFSMQIKQFSPIDKPEQPEKDIETDTEDQCAPNTADS